MAHKRNSRAFRRSAIHTSSRPRATKPSVVEAAPPSVIVNGKNISEQKHFIGVPFQLAHMAANETDARRQRFLVALGTVVDVLTGDDIAMMEPVLERALGRKMLKQILS